MTNDKDPTQLAIDALDAALDSHGVNASKYIRASLKQLRALQSQPAAAHGVEGLDEALAHAEKQYQSHENLGFKKKHSVHDLEYLKISPKQIKALIQAARLYAQSAQPLPADKQAALDAVLGGIDDCNDDTVGQDLNKRIGYRLKTHLKTIKSLLTAPQPVADLEGLKDEASKKLKNFSAEHLFGVYEFLDHLHATGRLTTSADVQELKDAVRDYEERLTLDQGVFAHYADLHSTKGTEDGRAKCAANLQHANSIALVRNKHAPTIAKVKGK